MLLRASFAAVLVALSLWAPGARAQNSNGTPQQPAPSSGTAKEAATGSPVIEDQATVADTLPLAGAQNLTLGSPASGHSFLLPSFGIATAVQINPYSATQAYSPTTAESSYLVGRLALSHTSGRSRLSLDYQAGGSFSNDSNLGTSPFQNLRFADMINWGRWSVMFGDQLSYTSQSPFGFGGLGGLNNLGVGLGNGVASTTQFNPGFLPNQSIQIEGLPQISNAAIGELDYAISHRSSLTFSGSYGLLSFFDSSLTNSSSATFQGGYNYMLDRMNSIALLYRFSDIMFSNGSQGIQDHSVQFAYARRITGRLSFQVSAGPDVQTYQAPVAGPSTQLSWIVYSALNYQYRQLNLGLNYSRAVTGGGGPLLGSVAGISSTSISHRFNRDWEGSVSGGYARNRALGQTTANAGAISPQTWFGTAALTRHFVQYGSLFISYGASGQTGLAVACTQAACAANTLTQTVSVGYNWGLRPIMLE